MVDIKNTPMAREQLEIASQTASEAPVNGLPNLVLNRLHEVGKGAARFMTPALFLAGSMVGSPLLAACGERPAQAGTRPSVPEATAEAFKEQNPQTFESFIPNVGRSGIEPAPESGSAAKPEPAPQGAEVKLQAPQAPDAKSGLPADTPSEIKQVYTRLEELTPKLTDPSAAKTYQEALKNAATYTNPDRPPAIVENDRAGRYFGIYNQIVGQYYATRDSEILALAKQLRDFIKSNYPTKYESVNRTNGWEIKE